MFKYNSFEIIYYDGAHPMKLLQLSASILWIFLQLSVCIDPIYFRGLSPKIDFDR